MELTASHTRTNEFRRGIHAGISIAIGYFPAALTYGLLAKSAGLGFEEAILMSIFVFAGAAQYIALNLITLGTGVFEIVLTTFIVNIRHFLMSASLNEKSEDEPAWKKAIYSFGITDETFSVASMKSGSVSSGYMFGLIAVSYGSWTINSGVGFLLGASLPQVIQDSMGIALYAMFIGLLVPSLKTGAKVVYLAVVAASLNSVFYFSEMFSSGWSIVIATLMSAILVEWVEYIKKGKVNEG
ncbi:4-azaleucine resistance transporter AzlC [Bacillus ectoiniformans]|uniref:AzlC family ABC transporter permease n=1 Tax=Bacillus ectoiniformans TaxID=1494429 RepID=UPI001957E202|nr:AzlC family ABC transporter permease [Bacillus ectoiniformans]MBM7647590.1 4-azaleucine resistance transporter AzlC [Bacillus ectoiniformans]